MLARKFGVPVLSVDVSLTRGFGIIDVADESDSLPIGASGPGSGGYQTGQWLLPAVRQRPASPIRRRQRSPWLAIPKLGRLLPVLEDKVWVKLINGGNRMAKEDGMEVAERIHQLMQHLGINKAHFAARMPSDWVGLTSRNSNQFLSLTLVCPPLIDEQTLGVLASKMLVFNGDQGAVAENVANIIRSTPAVTSITFPNYFVAGWADITVDHTEEIAQALLAFLAENRHSDSKSISPDTDDEGEIAGISYHIRGSGPPLILFPLLLSPSQWEPLIPMLSEQYCTITLSGAELGIIPLLEQRGKEIGYLQMIQNVLTTAQLQPGQSILDIGSGTGVVDRWLAHYTRKENAITGVDLNSYLVREAMKLAQNEDITDTITFQKGNGEALSLPDKSFDFSFSVTALEEGDADKMLSEMVRVTKPGGKVAVIVRARDLPWFINLPLRLGVKEKAQGMHYGQVEKGCADSSLYQRFYDAGLSSVKMLPQLATIDGTFMLQFTQNVLFFTGLNPAEQAEWHAARAQAEQSGTYFISQPHHCAVGTKTQ